MQALHSYGVDVKQEGSGWKAQKGRCVAMMEKGSDGLLITHLPGFQVGNDVAVLQDGGYQKFLVTSTRKLPATADDLKEMHAFQQALYTALGQKSLYNLSLGTVSTTYHYDRVKGRANP